MKRSYRRLMIITALAFALLSLLGQSANAQLVIRKHVIGAGGHVESTGGSRRLSGTAGQPIVGISGNFSDTLYHGFWQPRRLTSAVPVLTDASGDASVLNNHPNPFEGSTTITYTLATPAAVTVRVFDMTGRLVRVLVDQTMEKGTHSVAWDAVDLAGEQVSSGSYLYTLEAAPLNGSTGVTARRLMVYAR